MKKIIIKTIAIILGLAILICISIVGCDILNTRRKLIENTEQYLKKEYGREFVCTNPEMTGLTVFGSGAFKLTAYPKDIPEVKFYVGCDSTLQPTYNDFLENLWSYQGKIEEEAKVKQYFGNDAVFSFWFHLVTKKFDLRQLNYNDVIKKYPEYSTCSYSVSCFLDIPFDEEAQKKSALDLAQKVLNDAKLKSGTIKVFFFSDDYREEYDKKFKTSFDQLYNEDDELYKEGVLYNKLLISYNELNNPGLSCKYIY